jgi:hypothetical protein
MYMLITENKLLDIDKVTQIIKGFDDSLLARVGETLNKLSSQTSQNLLNLNGQDHLKFNLDDLLDRTIASMQKLPDGFIQKFCDVIVQYDADKTAFGTKSATETRGKIYSPEDALDLELWYLKSSFAEHQKILTTYYCQQEVIELLAKTQPLSQATLVKRIKEGSLLAVIDDGTYRFPKWQFDSNETDGVIKGLSDVVKNLNCSDKAKISWFNAFNLDLSGATPLDLLKNGQIEEVLWAAKIVGDH